MEPVGATHAGVRTRDSGPEAKASGPAGLVARMTAPLAALVGHYQDRFVRDGEAARPEQRQGLLSALAQLPSSIASFLHGAWTDLLRWLGLNSGPHGSVKALQEFGDALWSGTRSLFKGAGDTASSVWNSVKAGLKTAWQKAKDAMQWLADKARAVKALVWAAISSAWSKVFGRPANEAERRKQEEAAYLKRREEQKYLEAKEEARRLDSRYQENRFVEARQQASRQAAADAAAVAALATDKVSAPVPGADKVQLVDNATLARRRMRRMLTGTLPA